MLNLIKITATIFFAACVLNFYQADIKEAISGHQFNLITMTTDAIDEMERSIR